MGLGFWRNEGGARGSDGADALLRSVSRPWRHRGIPPVTANGVGLVGSASGFRQLRLSFSVPGSGVVVGLSFGPIASLGPIRRCQRGGVGGGDGECEH